MHVVKTVPLEIVPPRKVKLTIEVDVDTGDVECDLTIKPVYAIDVWLAVGLVQDKLLEVAIAQAEKADPPIR